MNNSRFPDLLIRKEEQRAIVESLVVDAGARVVCLHRDHCRKVSYRSYQEDPSNAIKFLSDLAGRRVQIISSSYYGFDYSMDSSNEC